ncbi:hypothetical protein [Nitriliruptor alkaliphilus]|uniref:hypothetical protein n=1 Tax=Nitriliruptor alkaliphilus TaxID=427918 RepID=UPI0006976483|nr:hypothetical protein [Nitriliruptor alkaliphilus]
MTVHGRHRAAWGDEHGAVAGVEALAFGVLVFVLGTLLVANLWAVVDGRSAADGAARSAARAVITADPGSDVGGVAHSAATEALRAHGVPADRVPSVTLAGDLVRCGVVEVTVVHRVPLAVLPQFGARRAAVSVRATHAAVVDPYASGLPAATGVPCA